MRKNKMKYVRFFVIISVWIALLTSCGVKENIVKEGQVKCIESEQEEQKENEYTINRLFANANGAWVGDIMPFADETGIYLNYLYETDHNGIAYHPIYRFFTTDLCNYRDEGEILPCGMEFESPDLAIGTGSFIRGKDGKYHCFYTGHNDKAKSLGIDKECVMHAISLDNINWEKVPEDTFYAPDLYSSDDFRDPFVFWNEEGKCYWLLMGAKEKNKEGACIIKYTSPDLAEWNFEGIFYEQDDFYFMECPDLFKMNNWYYLIFSWNNVTYYRMAKSIDGPWIKPEIDTFDGNAFYAARTVEYKGKRYLFGFIDRKNGGNDDLGYTWAGSICPYELVQQKDGTIGAKMPSQYKSRHFTKKMKWDIEENKGDVEIKNNSITIKANTETSYVNFSMLPKSMLLSCSVKFVNATDAAKAGFLFGIKEDTLKSYPVFMDFKNDILYYDGYLENFNIASDIRNQQRFNFEVGRKYKVNLVVEDEVVILYINDKVALSNRIYNAVGAKWGIFACGTDIEFSDISVYLPKDQA